MVVNDGGSGNGNGNGKSKLAVAPSLDSRRLALQIEQVEQVDLSNQPLVDDHVFLVGRPSLRGYIQFVSDLAVDPDLVDHNALTDEWREAHEEVKARQESEAGIADHPALTPLPEHLHGLRDETLANPLFQRAYGGTRCEIMMIELDQLVVYQKHINLEFVKKLRARLSPQPGDEEVFRFSMPFHAPKPSARWLRTNEHTVTFLSPSNDMRYLGTLMLGPENIVGIPHPGNVLMVVGLAVGFGSNFLNAIHVENRLVLHNGSHRAYTLREAGVTHVPCIVQKVTREELQTAASGDLRRNPNRYLTGTRPSMLRDYFDPQLHRVIPCARRLRQVRVKFGSDESDLPAV